MSGQSLRSVLATSTAGMAVLFLQSGCGKDDGGTAAGNLSSLDQIPNASSMVKSSSGAAVSRELRGRMNSLFAVEGTPPKLSELKASADTYFWNGLVATINSTDQSSITQDMRNQFWGQVIGGPGGHGACQMAAGVGEAFGRMAEAGTSVCYFKNIPKASSGVTITGIDKNEVFKQGDDDKLIKIVITGEQSNHSEGGGETGFVRVFGKNTVGQNVFKVKLWFCKGGSTTPSGFEEVEVDKGAGTYKANGYHDDSWGKGAMAVTAYLRNNGGEVDFDPTKERITVANFQGEWGRYKGYVSIDQNDVIRSKRYNSYTWNGTSGMDKNYAVVSFSGDSLKNVKFQEGGTKGVGTHGSHTNDYTSHFSFKNTFYARVASNDYSTEAAAFDFSADSFFTDLSAPTGDVSGLGCNESTSYVVNIDMSAAGMKEVQSTCERDRFNDYDMCHSTAVQQAQQKVMQQ